MVPSEVPWRLCASTKSQKPTVPCCPSQSLHVPHTLRGYVLAHAVLLHLPPLPFVCVCLCACVLAHTLPTRDAMQVTPPPCVCLMRADPTCDAAAQPKEVGVQARWLGAQGRRRHPQSQGAHAANPQPKAANTAPHPSNPKVTRIASPQPKVAHTQFHPSNKKGWHTQPMPASPKPSLPHPLCTPAQHCPARTAQLRYGRPAGALSHASLQGLPAMHPSLQGPHAAPARCPTMHRW